MNKTRTIITTSIFGILILSFMIIGFIKKGDILYSLENIEVGAGEYEKIIANKIELKRGIYRIDVDYECNTDNSDMYIAYLTPRDESVGKDKLRSTGGYLFLNKDCDYQEFYLNENTDDLYIELTAYYDDFTIDSLKIIDTGKLWFCSAIRLAIIYCLIMLLLFALERIRKGSISDDVVRRWVAFFAIWVLSAIPWLCGLTILTPDGPYHMERVEGVANALRAGIFPVRIEPSWLQGYGYANGLYYSDIFLVFPAILRIIGFSVTESFNAYLLTVNALIIVISNYAFRKIIKNEYVALIMTAMYALSEVKYYQFMRGGAIGEGTALVFMPLVLLGFYEIFYGENEILDKKQVNTSRKGWIYLSIGYSGLICCHILSTEITIIVSVLFVLLNIKRLFVRKNIFEIIRAALFTVLMTLWFSVPFLESYIFENINIKYVYSRKIQGAGLYPLQLIINFYGKFQVVDGEGITGFTKIGIGPVLIISTVAFLVSLFIKRKNKNDLGRFCVVLCFIAIVLTAFSTKVFPWDYLQENVGSMRGLISAIQFPLRFLEWATLLLIAIFGYVAIMIKESNKKAIIWLFSIFVSLGIAFSLVARIDYYNMDVLKYPLGNFEGIRTDYVAGGEYVLRDTNMATLEYAKIGSSDNIVYDNYSAGMLRGSLTAENNSDEEGYIEFPLSNYRHYTAKDSLGNKLLIENGDNNVVRVILPKSFSGEVFVKYTPPMYWHVCEIISLISVLSFIALVIRKRLLNREVIENVG